MSIVQKKNYEFIEHTADIGIRVKGSSLKNLFYNSALALFSIIAEVNLTKNKSQKEFIISQRAQNVEELFINWLNELLSLSSAKGIIFSRFRINKIDDNSLEASVTGSDVKDYRVNTEVKAATYHQLKVKKIKSVWVAEVILDV